MIDRLIQVKSNSKALNNFLPAFATRISLIPFDEPDSAANTALQLVVATNDKTVCRYGLLALGMCLNNFSQDKQDMLNQVVVTLSNCALVDAFSSKSASKFEFPRRIGCAQVLTALQKGKRGALYFFSLDVWC